MLHAAVIQNCPDTFHEFPNGRCCWRIANRDYSILPLQGQHDREHAIGINAPSAWKNDPCMPSRTGSDVGPFIA